MGAGTDQHRKQGLETVWSALVGSPQISQGLQELAVQPRLPNNREGRPAEPGGENGLFFFF